MGAESRREQLLETIRQQGFASLPDLAGQLNVSESTIRRDVEALEDQGEARRTHGGVFYTGASPKLAHFDSKQVLNWEKKRLIAQRASELIEDGETVLLDGGSTTYELARLLVPRPLQIVTNSMPVANLFIASDAADLVVVGGYVHGRTGVTLGPYANQMLGDLNVRSAVLSVAGANRRGYYNSNLLLVETERAMMRAADRVIVVADSTKFGRSSLARMCGLSEIDHLVVDDAIDAEWLEALRAADVTVHLAQRRGSGEGGASPPGGGNGPPRNPL